MANSINNIVESIQNYFINHKEEYLTVFGLFSGSISFLEKTTPVLQYVLLILSVISVGISVFIKLKKYIKKDK